MEIYTKQRGAKIVGRFYLQSAKIRMQEMMFIAINHEPRMSENS